MLTILALGLTVLIVLAFFSKTETGVHAMFLFSPIVWMSWEVAIVGPINASRILGVVVPTLVLIKFLSTNRNLVGVPLLGLWTVYTVYGLMPAFVMAAEKGLIPAVEVAFRMLNGMVGWVVLQTYCNNRESFRKLLLVLMAAGLVPMAIGVYQQVTGVVWRDNPTVGLTRLAGLYHDSQTVRFLAFQTMTALILYWAYFRPRAFRQLLLLGYGIVCVLVLFRAHSKAGTISAVAWVLIWSIGRRKIVPALVVVCALFIANIVVYDRIWADTEQLFSKEIEAADEEEMGEVSEATRNRTLAGRWVGWEYLLDRYAKRDMLGKLFGGGNSLAAHNDYLASLMEGGAIGLAIYVTLLVTIGRRVVRNFLRERSPINVMALMLFTMWMVDTIGLTPRLTSGFQWYVWGFIGLAFRGLDLRTAAERTAGRGTAATAKPEEGPGGGMLNPAAAGPAGQQRAPVPGARTR